MSDEQTLPPHQPNTPRVWLHRAWNAIWASVLAYPQRWLVGIALLAAFGLGWKFG